MNKMLVAFAVAVGLISWNEIKTCHDLPWPPRFVFAGLTFGMLDMLSLIDEDLAGVIAVGFVLALALPFAESVETARTSKATTNPFTANCNHQSTGQPNTTTELSGSLPTSTTGSSSGGTTLN